MLKRSLARSLALAPALALLAAGAALAAPVTVQLRVEGASSTLYEGPITTDGHAVDGGDGTGPHPCDATKPGGADPPGPTMTAALDDAHLAGGWNGTWGGGFSDFLIDRIGPDAGTSFTAYWGTVQNFRPTDFGGCQTRVSAGDDLLFAFGDVYGQPLLALTGPGRAALGSAFHVSVTDGKTGAAVTGATVAGASTGADGSAALAFDTPGLQRVKASQSGAIRSNALLVCVSQDGTGDCGVPPAELGSANRPVTDSVAPRARISGPRDGARYGRGPRLLRGTAGDDVGITKVKLALRRHVHGRPCRWWSGTRERFAGRGCAKKVFFGIGTATSWSYLLPKRLPPGRYVLDVKAFDRARNRDEHFVRGANRVVFRVTGRRHGSAGAARALRGRVDVLIAGRSSSVHATIGAPAARVQVGRRTCRVAASTPLAALAALAKHRHVAYRLRDYGHCSRRTPGGSGQLFVTRVGPDANRGNDGWFYKVDDRAPEIGAGDPQARVRPGARVLWFYCVFQERAGSCQRSLRARLPDGVQARVGAPFRVTVRGYDNRGSGVPVGGATVEAGGASAVTGTDGVATLAPSRAGIQAVVATKPGMVRSFPVRVEVR